MTSTRLDRILRRDRAVVLFALAAVFVLAILYLVWIGAHSMGPVHDAGSGGMDMPGGSHSMGQALEGGLGRWSGAEFLLMFLMWAVMMIGMMTPSAAPMILLYARVARHAGERGQPFASTAWFAFGYLSAWSAFAVAATLLQALLEAATLLTREMALADRFLGGAVLIAAGLYQWTPLKQACLGRCRSPFQFIQQHGGFRPERHRSLILGLKHGAYCVGCCWGLMLLLFFGGVMNLLWVAGLAAFVLVEKLLPAGRFVGRAAGAALIVAGGALIAGVP